MAKIVLSNLDQLDFRTTLEKVDVIDSLNELTGDVEGKTYVLSCTEENIQAVEETKHEVYLPVTALTSDHQNLEAYVYVDLEAYPFYTKAQEIISKEDKPKGVFRFRRKVNSKINETLIAGDLYVLSNLLGSPEDVQVKQTDHAKTPSHVIIMINFGGGTMAHIEYTFTNEERIEFEWSGVKNIIDFDSEALKPIQPDHEKNLALVYPVDSVLSTAHKVNQELIDQLDHFKTLIDGGAR